MDPFLGEIRATSFSIVPRGWALCNGQILSIQQNAALFSLLGTTYGGDGTSNFALPDLRSRVPLHFGDGVVLGVAGGAEAVALTATNLPAHQHQMQASTDFANNSLPAGGIPGAKPRGGLDIYGNSGSAMTNLNPQAVSVSGNGQPHENMQPFLVLNFMIALQGIYPTRN